MHEVHQWRIWTILVRASYETLFLIYGPGGPAWASTLARSVALSITKSGHLKNPSILGRITSA